MADAGKARTALEKLKEDVEALTFQDERTLTSLRHRGAHLLLTFFGENSRWESNWNTTEFDYVGPMLGDMEPDPDFWNMGRDVWLGILEGAIAAVEVESEWQSLPRSSAPRSTRRTHREPNSDGSDVLLDNQELDRLLDALESAGLMDSETRLLLVKPLPRGVSAALPTSSTPSRQIMSDLLHLNCMPTVPGSDELPLVIWLRMAKRLSSHLPQRETFDALLARLGREG